MHQDSHAAASSGVVLLPVRHTIPRKLHPMAAASPSMRVLGLVVIGIQQILAACACKQHSAAEGPETNLLLRPEAPADETSHSQEVLHTYA